MASDLNHVSLIGRLTKDVELRSLPSGVSVATIRIAVNSSRKDAGGNWVEKGNFFDVTLFGRTAETAAQYIGRGKQVGVTGRLEFQEWEAQDGTKRSTVKVIADHLQFLGSPLTTEGQEAGDGYRQPTAPPVQEALVQEGSTIDDDDIPF